MAKLDLDCSWIGRIGLEGVLKASKRSKADVNFLGAREWVSGSPENYPPCLGIKTNGLDRHHGLGALRQESLWRSPEGCWFAGLYLGEDTLGGSAVSGTAVRHAP